MIGNDFLGTFLSLSPIVVGVVIFLFDFLTLFIIAVKTKTVHSILFNNKAILIGDFLLLPLAAGLIVLFYQEVKDPVQIANPLWTQLIFVLALFTTIYSAIKFKLLNPWWFPHGLFYFIFVYLLLMFFSQGIVQLLFGKNQNLGLLWILFIVIVLCVGTQQVLGIVYPKRFPLRGMF